MANGLPPIKPGGEAEQVSRPTLGPRKEDIQNIHRGPLRGSHALIPSTRRPVHCPGGLSGVTCPAIMAKRAAKGRDSESIATAPAAGKPSSLLDTRVVYCGDNLEQLAKLPDRCIDLIYIDPPFNSNRNYEVFWGETKEKRLSLIHI